MCSVTSTTQLGNRQQSQLQGLGDAQWLRALADSLHPEHIQRWEIDPAGNRLPGNMPTEQQPQENWAELVHRRWLDPSFNLLGEGSTPKQPQGKVDQWQDNRIGWNDNNAWRYSSQGNRIEQATQQPNGQYSRQRLSYDGSNQLSAVQVEATNPQGNLVGTSSSHYVNDALSRRLKKTVTGPEGKTQVTYFGWDGDTQVHTETTREDGARQIVHTIYEPGTFTPLVRLSTTHSQQQNKPHLLMRAMQAGMAGKAKDNPAITHALNLMQTMLGSLPQQQQKQLEQTLGQAMRQGIAPIPMPGNMIEHSQALMQTMRQGLEEANQQEQTPIQIHYYHCDYLGTPIALTNQQGQITWAARLDPWGNVEQEFNPDNIDQPIRLPGQFHDRETGLYYNRHRYYDPQLGAYINQDPMGVQGGLNPYGYVSHNPLSMSDPHGLFGDGRNYAFQQYEYAQWHHSGNLPMPERPDSVVLGHSDFYGNDIFDYTALDHDCDAFRPSCRPLHFRDQKDVQKDLQDILDGPDPCSHKKDYGYLMHEGQDFYSHYNKNYHSGPDEGKCSGAWLWLLRYGHACDGTKPDEDMKAWADANFWTKKWVDKWLEKCPCDLKS